MDLNSLCKKYMGDYDDSDEEIDKNPEFKQISIEDFKAVITREVVSIDPELEFGILLQAVPVAEVPEKSIATLYQTYGRIKDQKMKKVVLYKVLSNNLRDLSRLRLPIASLYERFKHNSFPVKSVEELATVYKPTSDEPFNPTREHLRATFEGDYAHNILLKSRTEREVEEIFVYKEPKLKHLNEGYSREKDLMVLKEELRSDQLVEAYDEILKFNN